LPTTKAALTLNLVRFAGAWKHYCLTMCCSAEQSTNILRSWACLSTGKPRLEEDMGQAFQPAIVGISGQPGWKAFPTTIIVGPVGCGDQQEPHRSRPPAFFVTDAVRVTHRILPEPSINSLRGLCTPRYSINCNLPISVPVRTDRDNGPHRNHVFGSHH